MPFRCCVPGCKGNSKGGPRVHCFSFPSDEGLYRKWIDAIPRLNFIPTKTNRVCHLHFPDKHIMRTMSQKDSRTGKVFTWDLMRPRLKCGAIPSLFPNSSNASEEEDPLEIKEELVEVVEVKSEPESSGYSEFSSVRDYAKFLALFNDFEAPVNWFAVTEEQRVIIFKLVFNPGPLTSYAVAVNSNLKLETFLYGQQISICANNFKTPTALKNLDQISELLEVIDNEGSGDLNNNNEISKGIFNHVTSVLGDVMGEDTDKIAVINEQLKLHTCPKAKYRYSSKIMVFSSIIFTISPQVYQFIRHSGFLILPHPHTVKSICNKFLPDSPKQRHLVPSYVRNMLKTLNLNERFVILLMNEIDVKPYLDYNRANSNAGTNLTTIYAFMIHSMYSNFRELIYILPVSRINQDSLHNVIKTIIINLEEAGYPVFCVVSNNNAINGKAMSNFANNKRLSIVYPHPVNNNRPLFYLYDPLHLLKSVKCDWLNSKFDQTLVYPDFKTGVDKIASFQILKRLYESERDKVLKFDYPLNLKYVFLSNLEVQDVHLCQKIFDPFVVQALVQFESVIGKSKDTGDFIDIVLRWWNIVNDNAAFNGGCSDARHEPIVGANSADPKLEFLEKMLTWLEVWKRRKVPHRLTPQTHNALYHTIHGMLEITKYCFEELKLNYVLLGKFRTDLLEHRFGKYRRLIGSQYISIRKMYALEKKLVIQSLPALKSPSFGHVPIEVLYEKIDEVDERSDETPLNPSIIITEDDFEEFKDEIPVLTYLTGYCCHVVLKNKLKCEFCKERLVYPEELVVEDSYNLVRGLKKGDLLFPHDGVVQVVLCIFVVFNKVLENFEEEFFAVGNKRRLLSQLVLEYVAEESYLMHFRGCDKHTEEHVAKIVINWVANTLLKNYYGKNRLGKVTKKRKQSK